MMNKIVSVLMKRDNMTQQEAEHHFNYVKGLIDDAISSGDYIEVDEIMYSELGLELDYIFDII